MSDIISTHMEMVYFVYGQIFFVAGLAILLKQRGLSSFRLARYIWLLAAFCLIHGISEWGHLFIPMQASIDGNWTNELFRVQEIGWALSFASLLQFAVLILAPNLSLGERLTNHAGWYAAGWSAAIIITAFFFLPMGAAETWVRYMLGFPAAGLTALAFLMERRNFVRFPTRSAYRELTVAGVCFAVYALIAGLIVPSDNLIPGLNYQNVLDVFGIPIQVFRSVLALIIAVAILRLISIFDIEIHERVAANEKKTALIEDRKRIARDLHDGTVQSIYAVGLQLEAASEDLNTGNEQSDTAIREILDRLNAIISDIRSYIFALDFSRTSKIMEQQIRQMAKDLSATDPVDITFEVIGAGRPLPLNTQHNIILIVHECLSNIVKHSLATEAAITLDFREDIVELYVEDNGIGIEDQLLEDVIGSGLGGLDNINERTKSLGGKLEIINQLRGGTCMLIQIPATPGQRETRQQPVTRDV